MSNTKQDGRRNNGLKPGENRGQGRKPADPIEIEADKELRQLFAKSEGLTLDIVKQEVTINQIPKEDGSFQTYSYAEFDTVDINDVLKLFKTRWEIHAKVVAKWKADKQALLTMNRKWIGADNIKENPDVKFHHYQYYFLDSQNSYDDQTLQDIKAALKLISAKENAEKEAAKAAEAARLEAQKEVLKTWATAHGDDLLKARIEENFNWFELAKIQYAKSLFPNAKTWKAVFEDDQDADSNFAVKNPTLEQINALRKVKENQQASNADIRTIKFNDDYEDGGIFHRTYINFEVDCLGAGTIDLVEMI
jgi:hypothetical protein